MARGSAQNAKGNKANNQPASAKGAGSHLRANKGHEADFDDFEPLVEPSANRDIAGVVIAVLAIASFIAVISPATAPVTAAVAGFYHLGFGLGAYVLPIVILLFAATLFLGEDSPLNARSVARGAVVFMGDLMRKIELPTNIDFMAVSSYGDGVKSSGIVRIIKDLDIDIRGRDVLIVEDILDSGLTLKYLMKNLESRKPASLEVAAFLWKDVENRTSAITPKYVGTHCPDAFVVGYGLDYAERYRNLPYLGILKPEVYS